MAKKFIVSRHAYEAYQKSKQPKREPIKMAYLAEDLNDPTINMETLGTYIIEEIQGFNEHFQIVVDSQGFVSGSLTPSDALSLGYKLIAWVVLTQEIENKRNRTPDFGEDKND